SRRLEVHCRRIRLGDARGNDDRVRKSRLRPATRLGEVSRPRRPADEDAPSLGAQTNSPFSSDAVLSGTVPYSPQSKLQLCALREACSRVHNLPPLAEPNLKNVLPVPWARLHTEVSAATFDKPPMPKDMSFAGYIREPDQCHPARVHQKTLP